MPGTMAKRLARLEQIKQENAANPHKYAVGAGGSSGSADPATSSPKGASVSTPTGSSHPGDLPGTPSKEGSRKHKNGLHLPSTKGLRKLAGKVEKEAFKAGKSTARSSKKLVSALTKTGSSKAKGGKDVVSPAGPMTHEEGLSLADSRFWDEDDEPEDDANWEGLEGFQSTPEQSDDESAVAQEAEQAAKAPDEKEPEAKPAAGAAGEARKDTAAEASASSSKQPGSSKDGAAKAKAKAKASAEEKKRQAKAKIEWDAKKFGHVRPLQCQSIWDIPTSKEPQPAKASPSSRYLQVIGKQTKGARKKKDLEAGRDSSPTTALAKAQGGAVEQEENESAWHEVPEARKLVRTVVLAVLLLGILVTVIVVLAE